MDEHRSDHILAVTPSSGRQSPVDTKEISDCALDSQANSNSFLAPPSPNTPQTIYLPAILIVLALWAGQANAQTPQQVNRAIDNGIAFLKSKQLATGGWPEYQGNPGGSTALVTLALLTAGVPAESDTIRRAVQHLRRVELRDTYVVSLMAMVFAEARPKQDFAFIRQCAQWLMESQLPDGRWGYGNRPGDRGDNSNTQYALLGLHAASQAGVEIPDRFWEGCRDYWVRDQAMIGSWGYHPNNPGSGSMTCAGLSSLVISNQELTSVQEGTFGDRKIRCAGARTDEPLERGLNWMGRNFSVQRNPGGNPIWYYYYLYGMERAGRLTGRRFFGEHDWYRSGVRALTGENPLAQRPDGSWGDAIANESSGLINTSFALLFLAKGRIPIIVNKLRHGPGVDWNNAPNDVHNLTQFLSATWQVKLNWQVVNGDVATVEDLLQAPILQFSGHEVPTFSPREKELLRQYVAEGGLIIADANCSVGTFDRGFRNLCKELFPDPGQELRRLEPEHGVWTTLFKLTGDWPLFGIDVGCRTAVFYSPEDLSCRWEFAHEDESLFALRLGANIIAYAVGPEDLQDKLETRRAMDHIAEEEVKRNFLEVAKIRHNGDWNPAPLAVRNLMMSLRQTVKIDVIAQERVVDLADPALPNYPLAYMHGRTRFQFDRKEREALAQYLQQGGVLFADACCGNERFDESFRAMVAELFPDRPLAPIPFEHELYSTRMGYDLEHVKYGPALDGREAPPTLEGVDIDGRYAIIYSKYDLGCALQRQQSKDCKGYTHPAAIKIASNIVLYALKQ